jgi:hypothetical protein
MSQTDANHDAELQTARLDAELLRVIPVGWTATVKDEPRKKGRYGPTTEDLLQRAHENDRPEKYLQSLYYIREINQDVMYRYHRSEDPERALSFTIADDKLYLPDTNTDDVGFFNDGARILARRLAWNEFMQKAFELTEGQVQKRQKKFTDVLMLVDLRVDDSFGSPASRAEEKDSFKFKPLDSALTVSLQDCTPFEAYLQAMSLETRGQQLCYAIAFAAYCTFGVDVMTLILMWVWRFQHAIFGRSFGLHALSGRPWQNLHWTAPDHARTFGSRVSNAAVAMSMIVVMTDFVGKKSDSRSISAALKAGISAVSHRAAVQHDFVDQVLKAYQTVTLRNQAAKATKAA